MNKKKKENKENSNGVSSKAKKKADTVDSEDGDEDDNDDDNSNDDDSDADASDAKFFATVADSLLRFRKTMWDKMQRKVSAILSTSQLASYKIDDFLVVLDSVYRFIKVGEAFSGCNSEHLRRSIKQQSKAYFENLHKRRMEDLSIMLANEQWQPCPGLLLCEFHSF